jgi:hypothetical protein
LVSTWYPLPSYFRNIPKFSDYSSFPSKLLSCKRLLCQLP